MAWVTTRPRRGRKGQSTEQAQLASELLQCLFRAPPRPQREEWTCGTCHCSNWMDRSVCRRGCGARRPSGKRAAGGAQQSGAKENTKVQVLTPKGTERPWQSAEAAKAAAAKRKTALEAAIAAARAAEGDECVLKELSGMLEAIPPPPREQPAAEALVSTRGFVERQTARLRKMDEEIAALQAQRAEMAAELQAAQARQAEVEKKLAEEARQGQGVEQKLTTLCADLQALQTLASRKKQRTEEKGEAERKDSEKENAELTEDAAMTDTSQPESVKAILMQLAGLGAQLQEVLRSVAPTQPA